MPEYKAPLRDIQFVRDELLAYDEHYRTLGFDEASPDIVKAILEEGAKFAEQILAPLNRQGDEQGCRLEEDGTVKTPDGFADAYQQFIESGWPGLSGDPELDRKSTRLNSSHVRISYAVFCLKKKKK